MYYHTEKQITMLGRVGKKQLYQKSNIIDHALFSCGKKKKKVHRNKIFLKNIRKDYGHRITLSSIDLLIYLFYNFLNVYF